MSDVVISKKIAEFLYKKGWQAVRDLMHQSPVFHFDVAVSAGGLGDVFQYRASQLRRVSVFASSGRPTLRAIAHVC